MPTPLIGIVGAGRTRNGLGPFLARFLEEAGCRVHGLAGRSAERAAANAAALAQSLRHEVRACRDTAELCQSGIQALVVCSPAEHHLQALQTALGARIACLCEKPLVVPPQLDAGLAAVAAFARADLLLQENCQWPLLLPALDELYPARGKQRPKRVAMGLSPSQPGMSMVLNSLSHLLSVVQAVLPPEPGLRLLGAELADQSATAVQNVLRLRFSWINAVLEAELHLQQVAAQPRPAWLAVDGCRMDRRIGPDYALSYAGNGREVAVVDPVRGLVARFAEMLRTPDPNRTRTQNRAIAERLRLYCAIVAALGRG